MYTRGLKRYISSRDPSLYNMHKDSTIDRIAKCIDLVGGNIVIKVDGHNVNTFHTSVEFYEAVLRYLEHIGDSEEDEQEFINYITTYDIRTATNDNAEEDNAHGIDIIDQSQESFVNEVYRRRDEALFDVPNEFVQFKPGQTYTCPICEERKQTFHMTTCCKTLLCHDCLNLQAHTRDRCPYCGEDHCMIKPASTITQAELAYSLNKGFE